MKIAILDTYYPAFLAAKYRNDNELSQKNYGNQLNTLLECCFGTSDFYSRHLNALGCEAIDIVANCIPLQARWAKEHRLPYFSPALHIPPRLFRLPVAGRLLASLPNIVDIAVAQIQALRPDVLYCQDLSVLPPKALSALKGHVRLTVGQIASPLPPKAFLEGYDLILTSFPHFVDKLHNMGLRSEYFRIGFDTRIADRIGQTPREISSSFVGGISRHHTGAIPLLEQMALQTEMQFFGYGAKSLAPNSPILARHHGEVWGLDMYRALAQSRVTLNRHIGVAENFANNMRLYEATGMGSMLVTDHKDNLNSLFKVGKELVTYRSVAEAVELVKHYAAHPEEASAIAREGQARTLSEHTYAHRMQELVSLLRRHLDARTP